MKSQFVPGQYFTGKDRSYPRSLYEYIGLNKKNGKHIIRHLFYTGYHTKAESGWHRVEWPGEYLKEYRPATPEEINIYFEKMRCEPPENYPRMRGHFKEEWVVKWGNL